MQVEITQGCIDAADLARLQYGLAGITRTCPVGQALRQKGYQDVYVGSDFITARGHRWSVGEDVRRFMEDWDSGLPPVYPVTLELEEAA